MKRKRDGELIKMYIKKEERPEKEREIEHIAAIDRCTDYKTRRDYCDNLA